MSGRIHWLDNLKSAVILLIVAFHGAMSCMEYVPDWWYVVDDRLALPFTWFVIWADNFVMPIMFFISGYFGLQSLRRWSAIDFWRLKLHRIGLPCLIGMAFFVPYMIRLWFCSRGFPISFHDLIFEQYFGKFYQQGVYWYLSALMALYLLLFCAARVFPGIVRPIGSGKESPPAFLIAIYMTAIPMFLLNLFWQDAEWLNFGYVLVLQLTRVPIYVASFFLGAYCGRGKLLAAIGNGGSSWFKALPAIFVVSSCLFVWFRMAWAIESAWDVLLNALIHCSFCALSLATALWLFRTRFDFTDRFLGQLAGMSYAIYFIHQNVGQTMILYVRSMRLGIYGKYALSLILTLIACYAICRLLRPFLSGKASFFKRRP